MIIEDIDPKSGLRNLVYGGYSWWISWKSLREDEASADTRQSRYLKMTSIPSLRPWGGHLTLNGRIVVLIGQEKALLFRIREDQLYGNDRERKTLSFNPRPRTEAASPDNTLKAYIEFQSGATGESSRLLPALQFQSQSPCRPYPSLRPSGRLFSRRSLFAMGR